MMIRLVLASMAALLAASTAEAQVGMRSPRGAMSSRGSSAMGMGNSSCPSGGGTAGMTGSGSNLAVGGSTMLGGVSSFNVNPSAATYGVSPVVANNGYGVTYTSPMGNGNASAVNFAATGGYYSGDNASSGLDYAAQWGGSPAQGGDAYAGFDYQTTDGLRVAPGATNASTDASPRPRARAKKSLSKTKPKTAKSKSS